LCGSGVAFGALPTPNTAIQIQDTSLQQIATSLNSLSWTKKQVPNNRRISFESMKTCSIVKVGGAK
jgi:hypothetical protein